MNAVNMYALSTKQVLILCNVTLGNQYCMLLT